jgi:hypothetical protein
MDFSGFLSGFLGALAAGVILLILGSLVVAHFVDLRERRRSRLSVLKAMAGELYSNAAQLTVALHELPTGGVPFPLFDVGMWAVLSQATVFTTLKHETVSSLMHAYNRMGAANDQCAFLLDLNQGQTGILAMASFAGRMDDAQVVEMHDQFQARRAMTRDYLVDRLRDLSGFLNVAIDAVEAEVGVLAPPASQREFLPSGAGPDGRPIGTPRRIIKIEAPKDGEGETA